MTITFKLREPKKAEEPSKVTGKGKAKDVPQEQATIRQRILLHRLTGVDTKTMALTKDDAQKAIHGLMFELNIRNLKAGKPVEVNGRFDGRTFQAECIKNGLKVMIQTRGNRWTFIPV